MLTRREHVAPNRLALLGASLAVVGILTMPRLHWVLNTAGLVSYAAWNVLFLVTLVLAAAALHRRMRAGVP
jgi:hypothetical protein